MVGIVVASHGLLARELLETATMILGPLAQTLSCDVEPGISPAELKSKISASIHSVDTGDGVLVFSDLLGGSACTQSLMLCRECRMEVVTGVNLPMVLKAQSLRASGKSLSEIAHAVIEFGRSSITCATDRLRADQAPM